MCSTTGRKEQKVSLTIYTVTRPPHSFMRQCTRYGESLGLAFQVGDDLLDAEGDEKIVGKRLRKDVTKQTYIKHYGVVQSRARLDELVNEAVQALAFLGPAGEVLPGMAEFVAKRSC